MARFIVTTLFLVTGLFFSSAAYAAEWFVATTGDDTSGNGSLSSPYRTPQKALSVAAAGDTVTLRGGSYAGPVRITRSSITLRSYTGEWASIWAPTDNSSIPNTVVIDLNAHGARLSRLDISGGHYYTIKLESNWDWGEATQYGVSKVVIEDSKIHDSGTDIIKITPGCNDVLVQRNEIYRSGRRLLGTTEPNAQAIDAVNADRLTVRDNYVHDIVSLGIKVKGGSIGTVIERNWVENVEGIGIALGQYTDPEWFKSSNTQFYENIDGIARNNVVVNAKGAGIGMIGALRPKVINNTLVRVANTWHGGILITEGAVYQPPDYTQAVTPPTVDPVVINNIVVVASTSSRANFEIRQNGLEGTLTASHNRYFKEGGTASFWDARSGATWQGNLSAWMTRMGETSSTEGNPGLTTSQHLSSTSPCIDAGLTRDDVRDDIDKQARGATRYDIGADEFLPTSPPPTPAPSPTPTWTPTPTPSPTATPSPTPTPTATPTATPPPTTNRVQNPSFENGVTSWNLDYGGTTVVTGHAFSGQKALRIRSAGGGRAQWLTGVAPGRAYHFSAAAKGDRALALVQFFDAQNRELSRAEIVTGSTAYRERSVQVTTPVGMVSARVTLWKDPTSNPSFFDRIIFELVP